MENPPIKYINLITKLPSLSELTPIIFYMELNSLRFHIVNVWHYVKHSQYTFLSDIAKYFSENILYEIYLRNL